MAGIVWNNTGLASGVARQSVAIVPDNCATLAPSMVLEYSRVFSLLAPCYRGAATSSSWQLYFDRGPKGVSQNNQSDSAVAAHRQRRCSSVKYGRIFPSRALLAARSATLGLGLVISRHSLTSCAMPLTAESLVGLAIMIAAVLYFAVSWIREP